MKLTAWLGSIALQVLIVGTATPPIAKSGPGEDRLATQHFFCSTGYALDACREQIATLKTVVAKFPTEALGPWTWVLVRSQDWKQLTKMAGFSLDSPAFVSLDTRTTFVEEALVVRVPGRSTELIRRWGMGTTDLLNTAVAHEMAHALCHSRDEDKATRLAGRLEKNNPISCQSGL